MESLIRPDLCISIPVSLYLFKMRLYRQLTPNLVYLHSH